MKEIFKELSKEKVSRVEDNINENWKKMDILDKCIDGKYKTYVFYDGPATANGMPGLHHMVAKFLKDAFCKYHTMKGEKVLRKIGWDTHGLPVEVQVEKKLGFKDKTDIEKYGIKEFNEECRKTVWENEKAFADLTTKMGQFIDLENRYITYDNNYIETEWWILKKFFDEGLFYEGAKILPYCTRCGTGLASHEVAQGYKEISVDTVIVPMKKKDEENTYFLVWTTTPWTLIANVALCVNPNEEYIKASSQGYNFIVAKKLANKVLGDDFETLETYKGSDLEYTEYEQLLPFLTVDKKAFYVTCDNYVTMEDGTGVVHLAPAFGADDANVGKRYGLPYLNPVGENGCYTDGPWKGMRVFDADEVVIKYLKENDPTCKVIFIGPCTAKKKEIQQEEVKKYVDNVLTFEELQALFDSREFDITTFEEDSLDNASYYGRIFARSGGLSDAVKEALKENNITDFDLKAVTCDGIEQCKIALLKKNKNLLDGNFIEGMACLGGCIGGAGCLTHGEKNKAEVDKYGMEAYEKTISDAISIVKMTK